MIRARIVVQVAMCAASCPFRGGRLFRSDGYERRGLAAIMFAAGMRIAVTADGTPR